MNAEQLSLPLNLRPGATFENYYPGSNLEVISSLYQLANGRGQHFIYLWGASGTGRTHLLESTCHAAQAVNLPVCYLSFPPIKNKLTPDMLQDLSSMHLICIDNIEAIAHQDEWEKAVFDLYNDVMAAHKRLVVSSDRAPFLLKFHLADLLSRLQSGVVYEIKSLSDEQKIQALKFRAKVLGLKMLDDVVRFLLSRYPRDMKSLFNALDQLDKASLQLQRRLTIPFIKSVLKI